MEQVNENIFVIKGDMENRDPEDIARDAVNQIAALFDRLVEEKKEGERNWKKEN